MELSVTSLHIRRQHQAHIDIPYPPQSRDTRAATKLSFFGLLSIDEHPVGRRDCGVHRKCSVTIACGRYGRQEVVGECMRPLSSLGDLPPGSAEAILRSDLLPENWTIQDWVSTISEPGNERGLRDTNPRSMHAPRGTPTSSSHKCLELDHPKSLESSRNPPTKRPHPTT